MNDATIGLAMVIAAGRCGAMTCTPNEEDIRLAAHILRYLKPDRSEIESVERVKDQYAKAASHESMVSMRVHSLQTDCTELSEKMRKMQKQLDRMDEALGRVASTDPALGAALSAVRAAWPR